ncbi:MAG: hypothetical protein SPI78_09090, partial [Bergeyella zoohelcum]|nr:hypothetical protein [Bergeyella zoohelcum]
MNKTTIKISVLAFLGFMTYGYAQQQDPYRGKVGINTIEPSATMDVQPNSDNARVESKTNEGIIAPKLSKTRIANIETPVEGTLVYATDDATSLISAYTGNDPKVAKITEKGYYFYNGTEWVKAGNNSLAVDGSKWTNDTANNVVKLANLSNGTTPRTDDKNIFIHDSGKVGIGTSTPDRLFSILGDQPATDQLGQFIIKTEENSNSDAGITLLSKKAHASLKLGSGVDSDSQILFDMSSNFENNNYSKTFNIWYDYSSVDENLRYLGFRSNLHPTESSGIFFNVLGRLGLGVKEPKEKIDVYNPTGFTIMKASNDLGFSKFGTRDTGNTYVGFKNKFQLWNADETIPMLEVTQDGNVGIGMGNPSEKLEVNGSIKANSLAGSGNRPVYADAEGKLVIGSSTTIRSAWVPDTASNSVQLAITSANGDRTTHPISITDEGMVRATSF